MISTDKQLGGSTEGAAKLCLLLLVFLVLLMPRSAAAQFDGNASRGDDSDWWSLLRTLESEGTQYETRASGPPASNFDVAGVKLDYDQFFRRVRSALGNAAEVDRGDAGTARAQLCYTSADRREYLIFENGEVELSFYLFRGGPDWNGSSRCAASPLVSSKLRTASGLGLGESPSEIRRILGVPTASSKHSLTYEVMAQEKTSDTDLSRIRKQNPEMSDKEFHENYDFYTLSAHIEVRFERSRSVYVGASESEVY
ncbi:MAG TPA: hypothetical protein VFW94_08895 [Candidatus Acidoferrales bacterium]|nr:hypothetical protein [Candidatus Acidoferrales bacterium]